MSLALDEAVIAARFGAPKTDLELSKLILWKSEIVWMKSFYLIMFILR
jgi:hypothetical protein